MIFTLISAVAIFLAAVLFLLVFFYLFTGEQPPNVYWVPFHPTANSVIPSDFPLPPQPRLELYDRDHPNHPDYWTPVEIVDSTVAKRRGEMDVVTRQRIKLIQQRIEEKKSKPLTLEINRQ